MVRSMTGYGRAEVISGGKRLVLEIKSVNHRYLDMNVRMPRKFSMFEPKLRSLIGKYAVRGKIDVMVTCSDTEVLAGSLHYNKELASKYMYFITDIQRQLGVEGDVTAVDIARLPDVFTIEEEAEDENELWKLLEQAAKKAADAFIRSRETEGARLKEDLLEKVSALRGHVNYIDLQAPEIVENYRGELYARVQDMLKDTKMDENRILTEVAIFADKVAVDEEIVRLKSHMAAFEETLEAGGEVGRKLDFLSQEMNRESNTILSKTNDVEISNRGIDLKTGIEKIREQIQNLE
ncbi:MAG: YicC family protein [Lachnospiraceae bacterium]|nr:YicC family protein [Lachnospiraceae bacterium]